MAWTSMNIYEINKDSSDNKMEGKETQKRENEGSRGTAGGGQYEEGE